MNRFRCAIVAAIALSVPAVASAPANAEEPLTGLGEVAWVSNDVVIDHVDPDVGYVSAKYRCNSEKPNHLWVSAKQGGPDPTAEGSGATVESWYDAHPLSAVCDGEWKTQSFAIERHADVGGYLTGGQAWVQFCFFPVADDFATLISTSQWDTVKRAAYPTINVTSSAYLPGSDVTVKGSKYIPYGKVTVTFAGQTKTVQADGSGQFTKHVSVPSGASAGSYPIVAAAGNVKAQWTFNVQGFKPWAAPSSYYLHANQPISFAAHGFMPGEKVTVKWGAHETTATANGSGNAMTMSVPFSVDGAKAGTVKLFTVTGKQSGASATFKVTVAY